IHRPTDGRVHRPQCGVRCAFVRGSGRKTIGSMADNDDKRTDDTGAKKTLTLKGGAGLGNRPGGMSRGPSRSTVVVEKRTRIVPKPNAAPGGGSGGRPGASGQGRPGQGRPM